MMQSLKPDNRVLIGLGSNLGEPAHNLKQAADQLKEKLEVDLFVSPVYRSEPVGFKDQPWFLNQAAYFTDEYRLGPIAILAFLKEIEAHMGRIPSVRFGPRLIDLDLLFYDNWVFENSNLIIPHPRFAQRSFVLLPLLDLVPDFVDPRSKTSLRRIRDGNSINFTECFKVNNLQNTSR